MRVGFLGALVSFALLAMPHLSWAADNRNVTVVNATGYQIKFLGLNPPGDDTWNDNELSAALNGGDSVYVKFNGVDKGCGWNIRVDWVNYDSSVL